MKRQGKTGFPSKIAPGVVGIWRLDRLGVGEMGKKDDLDRVQVFC